MTRPGVDVCGGCGLMVAGVRCDACLSLHPVAASWRVYLMRFDHRRGA